MKKYVLIGALALGFLFLVKSKGSAMSSFLPEARAFLAHPFDAAQAALFQFSLPAYAQPYADIMLRVGAEKGVDPRIIFALGDRETLWGTTKALSKQGPGGTGDGGHGRGLMQIDDRSNATWLAANDWTDPETNIRRGVDILLGKRKYLQGKVPDDQLDAASISAYNTGEGNVVKNYKAGKPFDATSAGANYGTDVLARAGKITAAMQVASSTRQA